MTDAVSEKLKSHTWQIAPNVLFAQSIWSQYNAYRCSVCGTIVAGNSRGPTVLANIKMTEILSCDEEIIKNIIE
jgi:predicted restriction endonuclease